jgi:disulfide bond formation protein DsbB
VSALPVALNGLGLIAVSAVLAAAFAVQLVMGELPCPLCLLQRAGFIVIGLAFLLNVRFGIRPAHYSVALLGALAGAAVAGRQVLSHINPGSAGFGSPLLGLHLYTWAFLGYCAAILAVAAMLALPGRDRGETWSDGPAWVKAAAGFFAIVVFGNLASTLLQCGFGPCAGNPVSYDWIEAMRRLQQ